jgi:hypothetical protein
MAFGVLGTSVWLGGGDSDDGGGKVTFERMNKRLSNFTMRFCGIEVVIVTSRSMDAH